MRRLIAIALSLTCIAAYPATQPTNGPGGAEYPHRDVIFKTFGDDEQAYWLFEPTAPKPERAPVIVFLHGWGAIQPVPYGAWIDHLVKRGNIVVYPLYQTSLRTPPRDVTANSIAAIADALHRLEREEGHVKPDLEKLAIVGHSMGGCIAANLAARTSRESLPDVKALMCVEPGKTWTAMKQMAIKLEDMSDIPKETLLLTVVGEEDQLAKDVDAKRIFYESKKIPAENKNFLVLVSDDHGTPPLRANHFAPCAPNKKYVDPQFQQKRDDNAGVVGDALPDMSMSPQGIDALDYFGTWKLFDALTDAAFFGKNREHALGNTPEQRFMGKWRDGVPVKELKVLEKP